MKEKIKKIFLAESNWFIVIFLMLAFGTMGYFIWFFEIKNVLIEWNKLRTEDIIYILATLGLAVIAIFRESIERAFIRPELKIYFRNRPPYGHLTVMDFRQGTVTVAKNIPVYYFSFLVENNGKKQAKNCEAVIEEISKKNKNDEWVKEKYIPTNLKWVVPDDSQFISINPGRSIYCNLGHILHSESQYLQPSEWRFMPSGEKEKLIFKLELRNRFYYQRDCLSPGEYRIKIAIYSENARKIEKIYNIEWTGKWKSTEEEMLDEEIKIE